MAHNRPAGPWPRRYLHHYRARYRRTCYPKDFRTRASSPSAMASAWCPTPAPILLVTDDGIDGHAGEPFNILFDPAIHETAASRDGETAVHAGQTGNDGGLNKQLLVGPAGIEPTTSTV